MADVMSFMLGSGLVYCHQKKRICKFCIQSTANDHYKICMKYGGSPVSEVRCKMHFGDTEELELEKKQGRSKKLTYPL